MTARVTLKIINDELARLGYAHRLARAGGYFYFQFGEAADWLNRTMSVPKSAAIALKNGLPKFAA